MNEILPNRPIGNMSEMIRQAIKAGNWENQDIIAWVSENKNHTDVGGKRIGIICQVKRRDFKNVNPSETCIPLPTMAAKANPLGHMPQSLFDAMNSAFKQYGEAGCDRMWAHVKEHNRLFN